MSWRIMSNCCNAPVMTLGYNNNNYDEICSRCRTIITNSQQHREGECFEPLMTYISGLRLEIQHRRLDIEL